MHEQPAPKAEPGKPTRHVVLARNTSTPVASAEKTEPTAGQPASAKSPHKKAAHHWKSLIESIREITHAHHKR
ncbi:hypothetical protein [Spirosoma montaniterrae]|uniref:hypothetical protein n=1 Tax=Spirosoma montaniterrae TaxID=1178516 RepID=UPI0012FA151A|nr:hypothetical protein [Spirosoma montaniterrae]